ncbi:MAG TPA: DJ-1/PfpI family protein [Vicinamibacterales bacterium]|nr:DJ-1/PfpI family protein [Vicinamibacterales bacterium]
MKRREFVTSMAGLGMMTVADVRAWQASTAAPRLVPPAGRLIQVACAISDATTRIDFVGPEAVFQTWYPAPGPRGHAPRFRIFTVAATTEPVSKMVPDYTYETAPSPDIVVVPAQVGSPALHEWLRAVSQSAAVTMSVCTGARHLALAGLLDGLPATTHHKSIDPFAKEFPKVHWVKGIRFVEGQKLATSGGLTAGIDLALRIVERYFGREDAQFVADHLEYDSKRWIV